MNKKGAALAYTLIATMVLMILSTSLFTAAGSNLTLSTKNTEARQSYITCKSAMEYAKSVILQKAEDAKDANAAWENNFPTDSSKVLPAYNDVANAIKTKMSGFSVMQDAGSDSGFKIDAQTAPNGRDIFAECRVTLSTVTRTVYQTVVVSTSKSGSYSVSAKNQTVINKMKDTGLPLDDSSSWGPDVITDLLPVPAPADSSSQINSTTVFFVRYVFTYHVQISAVSQYSASDDRMQTLSYETDCTIGGSDTNFSVTPSSVELTTPPQNPGIGMLAVGGQYGAKNVTNGNNLGPSGNGTSKLPVIFKNTIVSSGSDSFLSAPAAYFMNSSSLNVNDTLSVPLNTSCAAIDSDFIYFNGNINGLLDTANKRCSALLLKNTRNSLKRSDGYTGIVQFNNTTIQLVSTTKDSNGVYPVTTKVLDGLYYFKDDNNKGTNLFDFANLDNNLQKIPESDYAKISSVADENYVRYLQTNIDTIVSGDLQQYGGTGWLQNGDISNGAPSVKDGKTVYCYVNNCGSWINTFNNNSNVVYGAKDIVFQWDNDYSSLTVPQSKIVTFQADYFVINTTRAIKAGNSSSKFLVKGANGDSLAMVFPVSTDIQYKNASGQAVTYTITAGTYSSVPSGTNLFSQAAKDFFAIPANHTYEGVSGSVKYGPFTGIGDKLEDVTAPNFLLYGAKYGNQPPVYENVDNPSFIKDTNGYVHSAYPVLFNQPMQISSGYQDRILSAPQVYFMNTEKSIYGDSGGSAQIHSDFIYYGGSNLPNTYGKYSLQLYGYSDNSKGGYIYFAQNCEIFSLLGIFSFYVPKGCYYFQPGTDLCSLFSYLSFFSAPGFSSIGSTTYNKVMADNYVNYMEQQHSNIISGDTTAGGNTPKDAGANWAPDGVLKETTSNAFDGKDVYLYVNDATKWGSAKVNYQASNIHLQYVNAGSLLVPNGKSVTFTVDSLSLNGQKTDAEQTGDKLTLQQGDTNSEFILNTPGGVGYVNVVLPHDLLVNCSSGDSYTVPAGVYKVKSGTNLFDYSSIPSGSGKSVIQFEPVSIAPVAETLFKKGKYTNE